MLEERYERLQILGEGSYGTALLVRERGGSTKYVAKEIRISHLGEKERALAVAEADVLRRLSHANIVRYVDSFLDSRLLYIIMEYADNGDLATQIKLRRDTGGCFAESEIMHIHLQLVLALSHIHKVKILHRDLKPLNIFLTRQWIVKLGDFGISKVLESTTLGAQTTIGTPLYLSPEICSGEAYGVKSDCWSLGVVTYEMCALQVPFQATSVVQLVLKVCGSEPPALPPQLSPALRGIVLGLLQKDPRRRLRLEDVLGMSYAREHLQALLERSQHEGSTLPSASMATRLATHPLAPSVSPTQDTAEAVRAEFHRNREVARLARERCRGNSLGPSPERPPPLTPQRAAGRPSSAPRWSDAAPQVLGTPEPPSPRRDRREEVKQKSREQKEAAEVARLQELEEARQQAFQERLAAKQRMEQDQRSHLGPPKPERFIESPRSDAKTEGSVGQKSAEQMEQMETNAVDLDVDAISTSVDLRALRGVLEEALVHVEERTIQLDDFQQTLLPAAPSEAQSPANEAETTLRPPGTAPSPTASGAASPPAVPVSAPLPERPLRPADPARLSALLEGTQDSLTYSTLESSLPTLQRCFEDSDKDPKAGQTALSEVPPSSTAVKAEVISLHLAAGATSSAPSPEEEPDATAAGDVERLRCRRFCAIM